MLFLRRLLAPVLALLIAGAASCSASSASDDPIAVSKYEFAVTRTTEGKNVQHSMKVISRSSDGRTRTEDFDASGHRAAVSIYLPTERTYLVLDMTAKTYTERAGSEPSTSIGVEQKEAPEPQVQSLPPKTIAGLKCRGYSETSSDGIYDEVWYCEDPIRVGAAIHRAADGSGSTESLVKVSRGVKVPLTFFGIPSGFTLSPATPNP